MLNILDLLGLQRLEYGNDFEAMKLAIEREVRERGFSDEVIEELHQEALRQLPLRCKMASDSED